MATPSTVEGVTACGSSASWLCGMISLLAEGELLFSRYPWVGFAVVSAIGGFVGWCVLLERGKFGQTVTAGFLLQRLAIRVSMGGGVGIAGALIWHSFEGTARGMPMLISALIAVFPLEAYRTGLKKFKAVLSEAFK